MPNPSNLPPSVISHISIGTNDYPRARAFYDAVLGTLQIKQVMTHGESVAYGRAFPEFWVGRPLDGGLAAPSNGTHISFLANSPAEVDAFYTQALALGATSDGSPGLRPHYTPTYYAAFVRDLDGHKIEAMCFAKAAG
ncbi:VOC family protein [Polaromonas sp.]|jgi:catechol 2,3-dioxygenase-like lactoylglutathione lyase family enzyme|uniref:VOC family protein n=1 Tax=Polaromonas sp. TaxID=1869339 RepID=UPI0037CC852F